MGTTIKTTQNRKCEHQLKMESAINELVNQLYTKNTSYGATIIAMGILLHNNNSSSKTKMQL